MNDYLLFALTFVALLLGLYFGKLISGLKSKNKEVILEEKNNQLSLQVNEFKNQINSNLENHKTELLDYKNN